MSSVIADKRQRLKVTAELTLLEFRFTKLIEIVYRMPSKFCYHFQNLFHDNQNGNMQYLANYFLTQKFGAVYYISAIFFFWEYNHVWCHMDVLCLRGPRAGRTTPIHYSTWWRVPILE
jgi:hypothetical protein